jgi:phosphomannomutase
MSIFKAYDIRGKYGTEITEDSAYKIGFWYAKHLRADKMVVGRDVRESSPKLFKALSNGIRDAGCSVLDLGIVTTPMLYFATREYPGIMITASHNPRDYTGFKFCKKRITPVGYETGLSEIEEKMDSPMRKAKVRGKMGKKSIGPAYMTHVLTFAKKIDSKLKVVIDAGNGTAGLFTPDILKKLKVKVKKLYCKPDGTFPNRSPDPLLPKTTKDLQKLVKAEKADLGVAYDADGDRIFFIDEKGQRIRSDHILILLAREAVTRKEQIVIADLRCSWSVREEVRRLECEYVPSKVGHTNIHHLMKQLRAQVGGELSGHYYFKKNEGADNADIALLMILNQLSKSDYTMSELIRPLNRYAHSGEINFDVTNKQQVITRIYNLAQDKFRDGKINFLDGLTVNFKEWWFNIRPSNTQDKIRLTVEARNEKLLDKKVRMLKKHIE